MLKSITFNVVGDQPLVCESCEGRVERALKALQGVGRVRARASDQRIEVLFDPALLEPSAIAKRIDEAGYQTSVEPFPQDPG